MQQMVAEDYDLFTGMSAKYVSVCTCTYASFCCLYVCVCMYTSVYVCVCMRAYTHVAPICNSKHYCKWVTGMYVGITYFTKVHR